MKRNPKAACFNCAYWNWVGESKGKDGQQVAIGECRQRQPDLAIYPKTQGPSLAHPSQAVNVIAIERMVFMPQSTWWCGQHPDFFLKDDEQTTLPTPGAGPEDPL